MIPRINLTDPESFAFDDGLDAMCAMQRKTPIWRMERNDGVPFWAIFGHAEATAMFRDRNNFTSQQGMQIGQNDSAAQAAAGKMLIVTDFPRHRIMRKIIAPLFSAANMRRMRPSMECMLNEVVEPMLARSRIEFVTEIAALLPAFAICEILDVPEDDRPAVLAMTRKAFGSTSSSKPVSAAERAEGNAEIFEYFDRLLRDRKCSPGNDAISKMITCDVDGRQLSDDEIVLNIHGLITGGNETTRHASSGAVLAFAQFPDQWQRLRADNELLPSTVEEILRWTAPSLNVMRKCTQDTSLNGWDILAGERVTVWPPVVNRDPHVFDDPHRFDIGRSPNDHLTFGMGEHLCVGASLARLEITVLLEVLLRHVARFEQVGPVRRLRSNLMWGLDEVGIRMIAR